MRGAHVSEASESISEMLMTGVAEGAKGRTTGFSGYDGLAA